MQMTCGLKEIKKCVIAICIFALIIDIPIVVGANEKSTDEGEDYKRTAKHILETPYKFTGKLKKGRINTLVEIVNNDGSVQANDLIEYQELEVLKHNPSMLNGFPSKYSPEQIVQKYKEAVNKMDIQIRVFVMQHPLLAADKNLQQWQNELTEEEEQFIATKQKEQQKKKQQSRWFCLSCFNSNKSSEEVKTLDTHELVLNCKQFMSKLLSEDAPGSWIDVFKFMEQPEYVQLHTIFQLSTLQSPRLNMMINEAMLKEHMELKKKGQNKEPLYQHAVVEGAGPAGLFATFELFSAGMNVLIVNDRPHYIRNRIIFIDAKWTAHLRFFLGTKFDELFVGPNAFARITFGEMGEVNINYIEMALKERINELINYLKQNKCVKCIELLFETAFDRIEANKNTAIDSSKYVGVLLKGLKRNTENKWVGSAEEKVPLDLLICAGGANDRIRNKYLGKPVQMTDPKYYSVVVLEKGATLGRVFDARMAEFKTQLDPPEVSKYLKEQQMDELVARSGHFLTKEFSAKYANLTEQLMQNLLSVRLFENKYTVHISSEPPPAYVQFHKDLEKEKRNVGMGSEKEHLLKQFGQRMERKLSAAVYYIAFHIIHPGRHPIRISMDQENGDIGPVRSDQLNFSKHQQNTATFPLTITSVKEAVKRYPPDANGAPIVVAVGDANTSAHFKTAAGLSMARMGIEYLCRLIRRYHANLDYTEGQLFNGLVAKLNSIRPLVLEKVKEFVQLIDDAMPNGKQANIV